MSAGISVLLYTDSVSQFNTSCSVFFTLILKRGLRWFLLYLQEQKLPTHSIKNELLINSNVCS